MLRALLTALILTSATLPASAIAALPMASGDAPVLRIQGSNTINAQLTPALVEELMRQQGMQAVRSLPSAVNELRVVGTTSTGQLVSIDIAAHGSGTGFSALKAGNTDIAASSRPIKDQEAKDLAGLGDLKSAAGEQIIGIDGVAVILNPGNPLRQLDTVQLARIFSGEVKDWSEVGGNPGAIHLYVRDEKSGTYETFKELVLAKYGKQLAANALRFESSEQLSDEVSKDVNGIGFTGLPSVRHARAVAIADGESRPMLPTASLIATEDYPLSRRLYLYVPPATHQRWAQALVHFAQSADGQAIVARSGFVAQTVQALKVQPTAQMPADYQALTRKADRLSVNFRFAQGSARLDNKAQQDLKRVADYLKAQDKLDQHVTLVGFGDAKSDPARATLLSRLRAMAVRRELLKSGVTFREILGLGDEMPVANNDIDDGRIKNRRVEVWVQ
ncbi:MULTISPECIES: substrate-binding domain-containing protein [Pseudomonas syringae group]|uniref:OmpA family protein n=1 Tax=Pseudomonas coronafaciens pv. coronafaciens TaxID=235275 RepID=A0AAE6QFS0_9PSED|nr:MULTISPECIES: phosphate ABC transporter substrate-binding/OmpA family protein [Pseudomonas syringae group]MCF5715573.1 OmpA family protein [Pseudomonas tremae]MCF5745430.1 OmpA family protein [Pseudomonas tremae]QGT81931.1 OmpA family protein [Pseudomonas coronafaciens pv. coronafaciens]UQB33951.1 phosphate ABC transporter substrate-binding/OmpA family protein [Pseudomonas tremae]UQB34571.1 phosphate ABC transporter substrate-binding/OmpA family protein [Pseudomonas tremae]